MSPLDRMWTRLGDVLMSLAFAARRKQLGVRVTRHRDAKGRVTPVLRLGAARRGRLAFLHGFGDRPEMFLDTASKLARDFEVIIPAMPAFAPGWVDPTETHDSIAYGRWLSDILADTIDGKFHLMGNSLGGATALQVARRLPERVESMTLVCAAGVMLPGVRSVHDDAREGKNPFLATTREEYDRLGDRVFAEPRKLPAPVDHYLYLRHRRSGPWFGKLMDDFEGEMGVEPATAPFTAVPLEDLKVPTLVVWGDRDGIFPVEHGRYLAERIPGARFELLEDIGHVPHMEDPDALASAFERYVDSLG